MKSRKYGWMPDMPDHRDMLFASVMRVPKALPSLVDLRVKCSPVEDQGQLGSCTANALAGALEFNDLTDDQKYSDQSRLFIYYNERAIEGSIKQDSGAMIRDGIKSLTKWGCCSELKWPYQINKFTQKPTAACFKSAKKNCITSYHRLNTLNEMKVCLASGFPFVFGFSVYESFEGSGVAKSGKLNMPKKSEKMMGGHAVMAVGYNEKEKRFTIRNSWGADWGMKGDFTMPYNYLDSRDLADDLWVIYK